jgi:dephospho-CoA kinase
MSMKETVLFTWQPARRSILLRSVRPLTWAIALGVASALAARWPYAPGQAIARYGPPLFAALGGLALGWQVLVWMARRYTLTDRRAIATRGVFHHTVVDIPLERVQQIVVDRTLGERLFGLGTVCATSAGSQTIDLAWVMVARPDDRAAQLRQAVADAATLVRVQAPPSPVVIGLAGGVGSGKSAVAAELARAGYLVIDSDKLARQALDRPAVRAELIKWWGTRVLKGDGRVDRGAVAKIVFADPAERQRLEALVHPLVKSGRSDLVERARAQGAPGVVIDAPLLFEAGSDAECDYVMFVEAPPEVRLDRVRRTRGWDRAELDRREKAQIPLEDKRGRSDIVVVNDSDEAALARRVREALAQLVARPSRRSDGHAAT